MALFDHFAENAGPIEDGGNGFDRVSANGFNCLLGVVLNDSTQAEARAEFITKFNLLPADESQLDELLDEVYAGSPNSASKQKEFRDIRDATICFEGGQIDKARAEVNAGITPS